MVQGIAGMGGTGHLAAIVSGIFVKCKQSVIVLSEYSHSNHIQSLQYSHSE